MQRIIRAARARGCWLAADDVVNIRSPADLKLLIAATM